MKYCRNSNLYFREISNEINNGNQNTCLRIILVVALLRLKFLYHLAPAVAMHLRLILVDTQRRISLGV